MGPVALTGQGAGPDRLVMSAAARAAVEASSGLPLASVLALDVMEPTTALIASVTSLKRTYLVKQAKPAGRDRIDHDARREDARGADHRVGGDAQHPVEDVALAPAAGEDVEDRPAEQEHEGELGQRLHDHDQQQFDRHKKQSPRFARALS